MKKKLMALSLKVLLSIPMFMVGVLFVTLDSLAKLKW